VTFTLAGFRENLGLALEASHTSCARRERRRQNLDGNITIELGIGRAPDFAHAAFAEFGGDTVMGDGLFRAHGVRISGIVSRSGSCGPSHGLLGSNPAGLPLSVTIGVPVHYQNLWRHRTPLMDCNAVSGLSLFAERPAVDCSDFSAAYRLSTDICSKVMRNFPLEIPKLPPSRKTPRWIWTLFPLQERDSPPSSVSIRCGWPYSLIKALFTEG
jgi:hypothetical protein